MKSGSSSENEAPAGGATHQGVDALVGQVVLCGGVALHQLAVLGVVALADLVDLLVDLCAVVVALLTGTGHREGHTGRMPGTDAGHLTQTTMGLTWKLLCVPAAGDTWRAAGGLDSMRLQQ